MDAIPDIQKVDHLLELFFDRPRSDKYPVGNLFELEQFLALRQYDPVLRPGDLDELSARKQGIEVDVKPQQPHVFCRVAQIDIGNEAATQEMKFRRMDLFLEVFVRPFLIVLQRDDAYGMRVESLALSISAR